MGSKVGSKVGNASGSPVGSALTAIGGDGGEGSLEVGFLPVGCSVGVVAGCGDGESDNLEDGSCEGATSIASVRVGGGLGTVDVGACVCVIGGHPGQAVVGPLV
jgi:hypothetical protein